MGERLIDLIDVSKVFGQTAVLNHINLFNLWITS